MPSIRTRLLAATVATAALFVTLAAAPVEAQLIPFPTPLVPGLIGPTPSTPAPAAPAPPPKGSGSGRGANPPGGAPQTAPQTPRAPSPPQKAPTAPAAPPPP